AGSPTDLSVRHVGRTRLTLGHRTVPFVILLIASRWQRRRTSWWGRTAFPLAQRAKLIDVVDEIRSGDDLTVGEQRRGAEDVLELANVPRPSVTPEQIEGLGCNLLHAL